jgi:uncharacterized protein (DUF433 family)
VIQEQPDCRDRITADLAVMVGKPEVRGTCIPVERIIQHLAENPDLDDLVAAFPHLTRADFQACLAYAHAVLARTRRWRAGGVARVGGS